MEMDGNTLDFYETVYAMCYWLLTDHPTEEVIRNRMIEARNAFKEHIASELDYMNRLETDL